MHETRVDIGMRLAIDTGSYARVGKVMDAIDQAVREALASEGFERAAFEFTHFNTHPCKAMVMSRAVEGHLAYAEPYPPEDGREALPLVTPERGDF